MRFVLALAALLLGGCESSSGNNSSSDSSVWSQGSTQSSGGGSGPTGFGGATATPAAMGNSTGSNTATDGNQQTPAVNPAAIPPGQQPSSGCERFYVLGKEPQIVDEKLKQTLEPKLRKSCYRAFGIGHSGLTRTPLWSAEALTKRQLEYAAMLSRNSEFVEDSNLPSDERSTLDDYRGSGWDRGHMAPSADMPSREAQSESFYLSNIVPQNGALNGGKWADLEKEVRRQAKKNDVYVVTGPIYRNPRQALRKRVLVPTHLFKGIFIDGEGAVVYVAENRAKGQWTNYTVDQFKAVFGIDLFPGLPPLVRQHNLTQGSLRNKSLQNGSTSGNGTNGQGSEQAVKKRTEYARLNGQGLWYLEKDFIQMHKRRPRADEYVYQ